MGYGIVITSLYQRGSLYSKYLDLFIKLTLILNFTINVFRKVAKYIEDLPDEDKFYDVTHTGLAKLPSERLDDVLAIITDQQEQKEVLASLLLLDELPGQEAWTKALNVDRINDDWNLLMESVGHTLWHQTQESTDCRWLKVLWLDDGWKNANCF